MPNKELPNELVKEIEKKAIEYAGRKFALNQQVIKFADPKVSGYINGATEYAPYKQSYLNEKDRADKAVELLEQSKAFMSPIYPLYNEIDEFLTSNQDKE